MTGISTHADGEFVSISKSNAIILSQCIVGTRREHAGTDFFIAGVLPLYPILCCLTEKNT